MKKSLNLELLEFHVREAAGELDSLLRRIRFMLGRQDADGKLQVDAWGPITEASLEVSLAHAYHHMNFAWNVRYKDTNEADKHFDRGEKFPRAFSRFWPKSLLKKLHWRKKGCVK